MIGLSNGSLVAFDWLSERSGEKTSHARELSRNQSILRFDVMLQHHWPIEQCLPHIGVFFEGKTKSPCFDLFIHWLIKQIKNTYRNHFSRSYENRSIILNIRKLLMQKLKQASPKARRPKTILSTNRKVQTHANKKTATDMNILLRCIEAKYLMVYLMYN